MKNILSNLKIGTKLLLYSISILATLLLIGTMSSLVLKKISVKENNIVQSITLSDAIFEAKYFLRSDMHIFMEISKASEIEKIKYWQGEHNFQIIFFNDQIKKIEDVYTNNKQDETYIFNPEILVLTKQVSKSYNDEFLLMFNKLQKLKQEELFIKEKSNSASDIRLNEIKKEILILESKVINNGLIIIKNIDKAKDLTRNIVSNLQKETKEIISTSLIRTIIIVSLALLLISVVTFYFIYLISTPVNKIKSTVESMSKGEQPSSFIIKSKDEFGEIQTAINKLINSLKQIAVFAKEVGNNNFMSEYTPAGKNDVLGNSLLEMRNSLKEAEDKQQKRDAEEEKRKWANEGIALFSNVLRQSDKNLENLSADILIKLVDYLNANQGGLFIKNDNEKDHVYYELITSYAYNRRKYQNKIIELGEGLVGTCAVEKKMNYLTDIPEDYIKITSGLGGANPKSILIVPLKIEEEVLGVIEIASFNKFKKYEIEFVNEIADNIASTLFSVRVNTHTKELLEKTQQQAEEMAAQEEEMRQNMEELQATQEEADRKTSEMKGLINALNSTSFIIEYDLDGRITYINDAYLNLFGINRDDAIGTHHSNNINFTKEQKERYKEFWQDLKSGNTKREKTKLTIKDKAYLFLESYSPIYNEENNVYKILKIANDISEFIEN